MSGGKISNNTKQELDNMPYMAYTLYRRMEGRCLKQFFIQLKAVKTMLKIF